ncbi:MAG: PQQ-binding-like beta-propeller repeat protein [Pirellulales bacterium]|nr:PQQ-binding-like beta-propeller repeat protein [Pirellulales bacterium]
MAVDATSGAIVWEREVFRSAAGELPLPHAKNSYASPTPITDGESIYVHFGPAGTAALSMEGDVRWENRRIAYDARHGGGGSPVIAGDSLVFNCDGVVDPFVVALNRRTGAELWRTPRRPMDPERFAFATPLVIPRGGANGGLQVVSPGSHMVGSYDPQTGRELWHVRFENKWSVVPRPVFADGLVLACTGYEGPAELLAIRPEGTGDVTSSHIAWRHDQFVPHTPSPLVVDGRIYTVSDAGVAACTELATGKVVGKRRLGGNFSASPLSAGGRLYFPDEEGMCYVLAAEPSLKQLAANDLEEPIFASFAVVDDRALLIRTSEALYRIEAPK